MFDVRPAIYVIGLLVVALGGTMVLPMMMDVYDGNAHWWVFALSGLEDQHDLLADIRGALAS